MKMTHRVMLAQLNRSLRQLGYRLAEPICIERLPKKKVKRR